MQRVAAILVGARTVMEAVSPHQNQYRAVVDMACKKANKYILNGEYGIGFTSNTNKEFFFDLEDYAIIKDYCWSEHALNNGYHTLEAWERGKSRVIRMPWLIMGKWYDHKDHNSLNNRKSNLRRVSQRENIFNRGKQKTNTSGVIGVHWMKDRNKWRASIRKDGKLYLVGDYELFDDAVAARMQAEIQYFGVYAPQADIG